MPSFLPKWHFTPESAKNNINTILFRLFDMSSLNSRISELLAEKSTGHGFFSWMEENTGITSGRWRNVARGQQVAMHDMIEAIFKLWPEEIFHLITGTRLIYTIDPIRLLRHVQAEAAHSYRTTQAAKFEIDPEQFGIMVVMAVARMWADPRDTVAEDDETGYNWHEWHRTPSILEDRLATVINHETPPLYGHDPSQEEDEDEAQLAERLSGLFKGRSKEK